MFCWFSSSTCFLPQDCQVANCSDFLRYKIARQSSVSNFVGTLGSEPGTENATESQRLICHAETIDIFAMALLYVDKRRDCTGQTIVAQHCALTVDAATDYIHNRIRSISIGGHNNRRVGIILEITAYV